MREITYVLFAKYTWRISRNSTYIVFAEQNIRGNLHKLLRILCSPNKIYVITIAGGFYVNQRQCKNILMKHKIQKMRGAGTGDHTDYYFSGAGYGLRGDTRQASEARAQAAIQTTTGCFEITFLFSSCTFRFWFQILKKRFSSGRSGNFLIFRVPSARIW